MKFVELNQNCYGKYTDENENNTIWDFNHSNWKVNDEVILNADFVIYDGKSANICFVNDDGDIFKTIPEKDVEFIKFLRPCDDEIKFYVSFDDVMEFVEKALALEDGMDTDSSAISELKYIPSKGLEIHFQSGSNYIYENVSLDTAIDVANSRSVGRAYHSLIRGKYNAVKLTA